MPRLPIVGGAWLLCCLGLCCLGWCATLSAQTPELPREELPLRIRPSDEANNLAALVGRLYLAARVGVRTYQAKLEKPVEFGQLSVQKIGETWQTIVRLRRGAEWLQLWGEAAGTDYVRRSELLEADMYRLVDEYKKLPGKAELLARERPRVDLLVDKHRQRLPAIARLVNQRLWERAESELLEAFDELEIVLVFYDRTTRDKSMQPFLSARDAVFPPAAEVRKQRTLASLAKARAEHLPDFAALLAQAEQAAAAPGGPAALARLCDQWNELHVRALRVRGLDWQRSVLDPAGAVRDREQLAADHADCWGKLPGLLAKIIEADAARVSPEQARDLYVEYLQALGPRVGLASPGVLAQAWEPALAKLAARHPPLELEVAEYRKLTDETLRWRKLAADSAQRRALGNDDVLGGVLLAACRPEGAFPGLVPNNATSLAGARLATSAPMAFTHVQPRLVGQRAVVERLRGVGGAGPEAPQGDVHNAAVRNVVGPYGNRALLHVALPADWNREVQALRHDLFVTDDTPPLTLAAAAAVASAQRGDADRLGCEIAGWALEPLATYFTQLPLAASPLVAWGELPAEPDNMLVPEQVLLRVQGQPRWARHPYFLWEPAKP